MTAPLIFSPHHRHLRIPSTLPLTPASTTTPSIHAGRIYTNRCAARMKGGTRQTWVYIHHINALVINGYRQLFAGCIYTAWSRRAHEGNATADVGVYTPPKHTRNQWVSPLFHRVYIHCVDSLIRNSYRVLPRRAYIHRLSAMVCGETRARGAGGKYPR